MSLIQVKRSIVQLVATVVFLLSALLIYAAISTKSADSKATSACNSISVGQPEGIVIQVFSKSEGGKLIHSAHDNNISVYFKGAFVEKWGCYVTINSGQVSSKQVVHLD